MKNWMTTNWLTLNEIKAEFIILSNKSRNFSLDLKHLNRAVEEVPIPR